MSRHRLQEASTAEATVELASAPRPRRAPNTDPARPAGERDRAALAKEILAAVDDRIPLSEDVRAGEAIGGHPTLAGTGPAGGGGGADAMGRPHEVEAAAGGSRHRRASGAHARLPRWGRRRGARRDAQCS